MFLAAVKADGTVLMPSFHRPWNSSRGSNAFLFEPNFGPIDPNNPNWYDTKKPWLKYLVLRPRPADMGPGFPAPEDAGGDVKNLIGGPGGNDSVWLDLDFPVMTTPDGRQYKPLFAPLIVDLDGRVNLNVHGNVRGAGGTHVSNQGWGPWEVNLGRVLTKGGNEWTNLVTGRTKPTVYGRYGPDLQPGIPNEVGRPGSAPAFYGQVDYDACQEKNGFAPTGLLQLPGGPAAPLSHFPTYPPGYGNGSPIERTNHPLLYNFFQPAPGHRVFEPSNLEALLRKGDTGSEALTSDLLRLCPVNFADDRIRRLVTTHSFDLDRPGIMPSARNGFGGFGGIAPNDPRNLGEFGPDGRANDAFLGRVDLNRRLPAYPAPDATGRINLADPAARSQFLAAQGARQQLAKDIFDRLRVSVTGDLPGTPIAAPIDANTRVQFAALRFLAQLAVNIVDFIDSDDVMTPFNWFPTPYTDPGPGGQKHPAGDWVFGTELPRVVLNEIYAEVVNDPNDPGLKQKVPGATTALYKFWVELHNPFVPDPLRPDSGVARLQVPAAGGEPAYAVYHLAIAGTQGSSLPTVEDPANPGKPDVMVSDFSPEPTAPQPLAGVDTNFIKPSALSLPDAYKGTVAKNENGFYVLGPKDDFPGTAPKTPFATLRVKAKPAAADGTPPNGMSYQASINSITVIHIFGLNLVIIPPQNLHLRRLACPGLKPQPDPRQPFYNPYVTVDTMTEVNVNNGLTFLKSGPTNPTPLGNRAALGRTQPYAGVGFNLVQQNPTPPLPGQPKHTFFRHNGEKDTFTPNPNGTLNTPFVWVPHLDRQLVSPVELLNVSIVPPWALTSGIESIPGFSAVFFFMAGHQTFRSDSTGLFRALEFLECGSRAASVAPGGRVPGKININSIWDPETFLALCDPQPSSFYTVDDLYKPLGNPKNTDPKLDDPQHPKTIYWQMMATKLSRSTDLNPLGGFTRLDLRTLTGPNGQDRPFIGFGAPIVGIFGDGPIGTRKLYPVYSGVEDTLFRTGRSGGLVDRAGLKGIFELPIDQKDPKDPRRHPYVMEQLLNKICSQVTTRSNVFAVWLTVGFFEVTDATTRPVKLGAEIGRAEGRHVRHRAFAIVDRSNLTLTGRPPVFLRADSPVPAPGPTSVVVEELSGFYEGIPWSIQKGTQLLVDVGPNQEQVQVTDTSVDRSTSPPTFSFTAVFQRPHPEGFLVSNPDAPLGNPGPKQRFDPRQEPHVVRYFSIID
jgi:hypothetical protein